MADEPISTVTKAVSFQHEETWQQWVRSDKCLLLGMYLFLVSLLIHVSHDPADKEIVPFMREGAAGAFSGLMVALRGKAGTNVS